VEVQHAFFDLCIRWEWSASRPRRFTPRERASGTQWTGGWVGPRAVLNAVVKKKFPIPRRESNPRTPIIQPVAQRYTNWAIPAPEHKSCERKAMFGIWTHARIPRFSTAPYRTELYTLIPYKLFYKDMTDRRTKICEFFAQMYYWNLTSAFKAQCYN
jgi:hypothetical protein